VPTSWRRATFLVALLLAAPLTAAPAPLPIAEIDAVVEGADGAPLLDVALAELTLRVDGRPVTVTRLARPRRDAGGTSYVAVLLDPSLPAADRGPLLASLREGLSTVVADGGRVLVARLADGLRLEQPLTADAALVGDALERLAGLPDTSAAERAEEAVVYQEIRMGTAASIGPAAGGIDALGTGKDAPSSSADTLHSIRAFLARQQARSAARLRGLGELAAGLAGLPGTAAIVLVSGGVDPRPGDELVRAWTLKYGSLGDVAHGAGSIELELLGRPLEAEFERAVAMACAARTTVYALGPAGRQELQAPLSQRNPERGTLGSVDAAEGLRRLADGTGGVAVFGLEAGSRLLRQVAADARSRYRLGFASPGGGDGRDRRLELRVARPAARARLAARYRDATPDERAGDRTAAALAFDLQTNALAAALEVGAAAAGGALPLRVRVPYARLVFLPHDDVHEARLSLYVRSGDGRGRLSALRRLEVPLRIPTRELVTAMHAVAEYPLELPVAGDDVELVVLVRDEVGGGESLLRSDLPRGEPAL
jgi:VWFA-related protein